TNWIVIDFVGWLEAEAISLQFTSPLRAHPLAAIPPASRRPPCAQALPDGAGLATNPASHMTSTGARMGSFRSHFLSPARTTCLLADCSFLYTAFVYYLHIFPQKPDFG